MIASPRQRLRLVLVCASAAALAGLATSTIAQDAAAPANPPPPRMEDTSPGDADSARRPRPDDGPRPPRDPGAIGPNGRPGMVRPPRPGDEMQPADHGPRPNNRQLFPGLNALKDRPNKRNEPRQRERLELLARLPPAQILAELQKWPPFQKMSLGEQGQMLERIQEIKDRRREAALNKARDMGLDLTPVQQDAFELRYWTLRLEYEKKLFNELEPRRRAMDIEATAQLSKEFSPASPAAVVPPVKMPTNAPGTPAPAPPAVTTNAPAAPR